MLIQFSNLFDLPDYGWFEDDTKAERDALQSEIEKLRSERDKFDTKRKQLASASPIDTNPAAIHTLPKESHALGVKELKLRRRMAEWNNLFRRDRNAENVRASEALNTVVEDVKRRLYGIGYNEGSLESPGTLKPDFWFRHPEVIAARVYRDDTNHSTCHNGENLAAIRELDKQIGKMTKSVIG